MQQEHVLTELHHHIHQQPPPSDAVATKCALLYLEACNKIFENGFLSHDKILNMDSRILKNIDEGYTFFQNWLDSIVAKGMNNIKSDTSTHVHCT